MSGNQYSTSRGHQQTKHKGHARPYDRNSYGGGAKRKSKNASSNPLRPMDKKFGGLNARDSTTIRRLNMYRQRPIRNKKGVVVGGEYMMKNRAGGREITAETGRVQPDRRWFGNTRVIGQKELDAFREKMTTKAHDPYQVVLRSRKLPMGLLQDATKVAKSHLLDVESFEDAYNGKRQRKRPKITAPDVEALAASSAAAAEAYDDEGHVDKDNRLSRRQGAHHEYAAGDGARKIATANCFTKGQSARIWEELYKVLDCSDIVIQVLDARDVPGTRSRHIERYLKKHAAHKHLIFLINKVDLVPTWCTRKWVRILSAEVPTLAFHASITNSFGKGALINLLRQFGKLHTDKKQISVGIIGYPNVGKSSVINTLKAKKVCNVAPIPGETKIWQYITLFRRVFLIDCPGHVYDEGDSEQDIVLKGVVRAEKLPDPTEFIPELLARCKKEVIESVYGITEFTDHEDFLAQLATKMGRLNKCNTPNLHVVAIQVINDWQRGKLPYFVPPPRDLEMQAAHATAEEDKQREADEAGMSLEQLAGLEEEEEEEDEMEDEEGGAGSSSGGGKRKRKRAASSDDEEGGEDDEEEGEDDEEEGEDDDEEDDEEDDYAVEPEDVVWGDLELE